MEPETAQRLIRLNHTFYTDFGEPFSVSRGRIQPGVRRVLDSLKGDENILDLGCGNGQLARALARRRHRGAYLGLDFSLPLLKNAESLPGGFSAEFQEADLTKVSTIRDRLADRGHWSVITAFAVLHHIPGQRLRFDILKTVREFLARDGRFIHSNWQFLNSPRLTQRVQPWNQAGLTEAQVDPGDYLLDWRAGGQGRRYVHHFGEAELAELAESSGFEIVDEFYSDGKEGNLAIYQEWRFA